MQYGTGLQSSDWGNLHGIRNFALPHGPSTSPPQLDFLSEL